MPSLKEYKAKLVSLQNMRKITKTMKMVAASKLNKAMEAQRSGMVFSEKLRHMISRLASSVDERSHPLLRHVERPEKVLIVLFTSDKGLCGSFNNGLIKNVWRWIHSPEHGDQKITLSFCGRRGHLFYRSRMPVKTYYEGVTAKPAYTDAIRIAKDVCASFVAGDFDEVYLAYNHFLNPLSQRPMLQKLLPIAPDIVETEQPSLPPELILEPPEKELLATLIPKTVEYEIFYALLENAAGENGARMTAMDSATSNASNLIDLYTLLRNRARQASITKELIEIVSGAEALKG